MCTCNIIVIILVCTTFSKLSKYGIRGRPLFDTRVGVNKTHNFTKLNAIIECNTIKMCLKIMVKLKARFCICPYSSMNVNYTGGILDGGMLDLLHRFQNKIRGSTYNIKHQNYAMIFNDYK